MIRADDLMHQRSHLKSSQAPRVTTIGDMLSQSAFVAGEKALLLPRLEELFQRAARCVSRRT